ncbi:hypothetical protein JTB14_010816 [Gonioctena quinquepunctata]|nr:hypothetical protein JTB14_010816 [Gonioctena quinquepunctata]
MDTSMVINNEENWDKDMDDYDKDSEDSVDKEVRDINMRERIDVNFHTDLQLEINKNIEGNKDNERSDRNTNRSPVSLSEKSVNRDGEEGERERFFYINNVQIPMRTPQLLTKFRLVSCWLMLKDCAAGRHSRANIISIPPLLIPNSPRNEQAEHQSA